MANRNGLIFNSHPRPKVQVISKMLALPTGKESLISSINQLYSRDLLDPKMSFKEIWVTATFFRLWLPQLKINQELKQFLTTKNITKMESTKSPYESMESFNKFQWMITYLSIAMSSHFFVSQTKINFGFLFQRKHGQKLMGVMQILLQEIRHKFLKQLLLPQPN